MTYMYIGCSDVTTISMVIGHNTVPWRVTGHTVRGDKSVGILFCLKATVFRFMQLNAQQQARYQLTNSITKLLINLLIQWSLLATHHDGRTAGTDMEHEQIPPISTIRIGKQRVNILTTS